MSLASAAAIVAVGWTFQNNLGSAPASSDEPPAIILRAPEGFSVDELGALSFGAAAATFMESPDTRTGLRFIDDGDVVILLVDRGSARIAEMRASATGTIVERVWVGDIDRRLAWAVEHGDLTVPGMPPPTGKNLYH